MLKRRLTRLFLMMLCMALPCLALAEPQIHAFAGYDDTALSGCWYPLFVEITAEDSDVEGVLETKVRVGIDGYDVLRMPVSVDRGETGLFRFSIRPQALQRTYDVMLTTTGGEQYHENASVQHMADKDALLIGVLGSRQTAQALGKLERHSIHGEREKIEAVVLSAECFANSGREMDAFDALIVMNEGDSALRDEQKKLLEDWQSRGGVLLRWGLQPSDEQAPQHMLAQIESALEDGGGIQRESGNYRYGESLNTAMQVKNGKGLCISLMLLVLYMGVSGFGAYFLMKRMDRSNALWLLIPVLTVCTCALLTGLGSMAGVNRPMSSSVHVTHYKEDGRVETQELALLTYAGQQRVTVSSQSGLPLERMEYGYYYDYAQEQADLNLRDRITLGENAAIELAGGADWLRRSIAVINPAAPDGVIQARAYVEEDGLHALVCNNTDTDIRNAVLLTAAGYAKLGDLSAGETARAFLSRMDGDPLDENGNPVIYDAQMLPFSTALYQMVQSAADPERVRDSAFSRNQLPQKEQQQRRLLQRTLELGAHYTQQGFGCVLVGETPQISCEPLLVNGRAVGRSAQASVLICEIPFEAVSPEGHFYYPQGTFKRLKAAVNESGVPVSNEPYDSSYVYAQDEVLMGFTLNGVDPALISEIRLYASGVQAKETKIQFDAYDWKENTWVPITHDQLITLDHALVQRVVSGSGEIYVRYSGEGLADWGVYLHNIIVEGDLQKGGVKDDSL